VKNNKIQHTVCLEQDYTTYAQGGPYSPLELTVQPVTTFGYNISFLKKKKLIVWKLKKTKCFHKKWISEKVRTNDGVTQAVQGIRAISSILQDSAHFENIHFIYSFISIQP